MFGWWTESRSKNTFPKSAICHCIVSIVSGLHHIQHHQTKFPPRFCVYVSYVSTQATGNAYRQWKKKWVVNHKLSYYHGLLWSLLPLIPRNNTKLIRMFMYIGLTFLDSIILYHTLENISHKRHPLPNWNHGALFLTYGKSSKLLL